MLLVLGTSKLVEPCCTGMLLVEPGNRGAFCCNALLIIGNQSIARRNSASRFVSPLIFSPHDMFHDMFVH
jgi:hypothetical protein